MKKEAKKIKLKSSEMYWRGKNKSEWSMQISKEEIERVIKCARVHGVLPIFAGMSCIYGGTVSGKTAFFI